MKTKKNKKENKAMPQRFCKICLTALPMGYVTDANGNRVTGAGHAYKHTKLACHRARTELILAQYC